MEDANLEKRPLDGPPVSPDGARTLTAFPALMKSWFVRYYDHLITLVVLNLIWFAACGGPTYLCVHLGFIFKNGDWKSWKTAAVFLWSFAVTLVLARAVFIVFIQGDFSWDALRAGGIRFWAKACALFLFWAFLALVAAFNLYFYLHWNPDDRFVEWLFCGFIIWFWVFWFSCLIYFWPLLFFQNPPFFTILRRSFFLVSENQLLLFGFLLFFIGLFFLFFLIPVAWVLLGFVFFFSFPCLLLEKHLLRYKITYQDRDYDSFLRYLDQENQRDWKYFLKPWENK